MSFGVSGLVNVVLIVVSSFWTMIIIIHNKYERDILSTSEKRKVYYQNENLAYKTNTGL
jgi:hypothetical protein